MFIFGFENLPDRVPKIGLGGEKRMGGGRRKGETFFKIRGSN